ncbi:MAG: response regulator, partial [Victivallales bacterium]|nr:response regulator [Victivallales bacterium]
MTTERETILIVDDTPENLDILVGILKNGYRLKVATGGREALELAAAMPPDLVLLDIMMPEMDGFEVCRRLKAKRGTGDVPVIFVSALDRVEDKILAFTKGGVDYV